MKKKATMRDIAQKLDVSVVTVSKALADKEGPGETLRQKIKQYAKESGYSYNPLPRHMKNGKTGNIGVIISQKFLADTNHYYWKLFETVKTRINSLHYFAILEVIPLGVEKESVLPEIITEGKVDGILVIGQFSGEYLKQLYTSGMPIFLLDFYDDNDSAPAFVADNMYGSYMITNYLIKNGHRDILFVGNIHSTSSIMDRYLGYMRALIENRIPLRAVSYIDDRDEDGTYIDLMLPESMPDAFVCNNDNVAATLIGTLEKAGYPVPEAISVVGFDNFSTSHHSNITTVEVNINAMVNSAVESMIKKIDDPFFEVCRHFANCRLIVKDTVKKMPPETADSASS
ncbi:MAG: substrate-binding domain-containing protein [Treponema sp.]|nr:substrate-binding domain-containing protein [Treponema sp.]